MDHKRVHPPTPSIYLVQDKKHQPTFSQNCHIKWCLPSNSNLNEAPLPKLPINWCLYEKAIKQNIKYNRSPAWLKNFAVNIELDLNRGINPFGPIRRQDTKIGDCHLAFSPLLLYRVEGWTASLVENLTTSDLSPCLKLPPIIWIYQHIGTTLFSPALWSSISRHFIGEALEKRTLIYLRSVSRKWTVIF